MWPSGFSGPERNVRRGVVLGLCASFAVAISLCGGTILRPQGAGTPETSQDPRYASVVLTADGNSRFDVDTDGTRIEVRAPESNSGGNLRMALVRKGEGRSTDQTSCVTWDGPNEDNTQPGLVLRLRRTGGRTRGVVVTNNIWYGARWMFNVHAVDTGAGDPMPRIGSLDFSRALGARFTASRPLPWRLCARAEGTRITVKAWSIVDEKTEPPWGDPDHTRSLEVPRADVLEGQPGIYIAHLSPSGHATFSDATVA